MKSIKASLLILSLLILFTACAFLSCQKDIYFDVTKPSSGTLKSNEFGDCIPFSVGGIYVVDVALNNNNFIGATINTSIPGTYNITSDTINGYSFSGTGTVIIFGLNPIRLQGSGVPLATGTNIFTIHYNNAFCKIPVNVVNTASYFPLTQNSWWSYDVNFPGFPGDSLLVKNVDNISINGNSYQVFQNGPNDIVADSSFYKKIGTEYYQRIDASDFTLGVDFDNPVDTVVMFLNEALKAGTAWAYEFNGTIGNQPAKIKYDYTLQLTNVNLEVNDVLFTNVHKVKLVTEVKLGNGPYIEDSNFEFFYAAGIGLIQVRSWLAKNPNTVFQQDIQHYQVF
jgi:hypothetical protein